MSLPCSCLYRWNVARSWCLLLVPTIRTTSSPCRCFLLMASASCAASSLATSSSATSAAHRYDRTRLTSSFLRGYWSAG
uniref:Uncharacterized protein n=1 Tax=Arundo donax TaxID=35708 RepID=A0A0A8XSC6_ARUDO